jgi:hypothetical protein
VSRGPWAESLEGRQFGCLVVLGPSPAATLYRSMEGPPLRQERLLDRVACACGEEYLCRRSLLLAGQSKSCGCRSWGLRKDRIRSRWAARKKAERFHEMRRWIEDMARAASPEEIDEFLGRPPERRYPEPPGTIEWRGWEFAEGTEGWIGYTMKSEVAKAGQKVWKERESGSRCRRRRAARRCRS